MKPFYRIITREIPSKGIAYLLLERCMPGQEAEIFAQAAAYALEQGAVQILAASMDPVVPLQEGQLGSLRLEHVHDMLVLERTLLDEALSPAGCLTLEPLTRGRGGMWLTLYNESFFSVPNSATYDGEDLEAALSGERKCGFALLDGAAVGVYELNLAAQPPEIEGIALHRNFRGRGLGRELLALLIEELRQTGYERCQLKVSTANGRAWRLYQDMGFRQTAVRSRWYQVQTAGQ